MDPKMRVSHAERQAVAEALRAHAAAGRLSEQELSERSEAAGRAVTHADLAAVTADLPTGANPGWLSTNPLSTNPVATGLIVAGIVVAVLIGVGLLAMFAMMAFMGPSMGWHC